MVVLKVCGGALADGCPTKTLLVNMLAWTGPENVVTAVVCGQATSRGV